MMKDLVIDMILEDNSKNRLYVSVDEGEAIIPEELFDPFDIKKWYIYEAS